MDATAKHQHRRRRPRRRMVAEVGTLGKKKQGQVIIYSLLLYNRGKPRFLWACLHCLGFCGPISLLGLRQVE